MVSCRSRISTDAITSLVELRWSIFLTGDTVFVCVDMDPHGRYYGAHCLRQQTVHTCDIMIRTQMLGIYALSPSEYRLTIVCNYAHVVPLPCNPVPKIGRPTHSALERKEGVNWTTLPPPLRTSPSSESSIVSSSVPNEYHCQ